jgi:hypothetical protein
MNNPFEGDFPVTQSYGEKITDPAGHTGIDYALNLGTPVLAAADGKVIRAASLTSGYGVHVLLEHDGGLQTLYGHLSSVSVRLGQKVKAGAEIGRSGSSGNSTGPHLHFEVRKDGICVDPLPFLKSSQPTETSAEEPTHRVAVECLFVRSGPGTEYPIVDCLTRGEAVSGTKTCETIWLNIGSGRWTAVRYQGKDFCETVQSV